MPDAREIAEHMIRSAVEEIDFMGIGEVIDGQHPELADDQDAFDRLHREVDDLIPTAVITITFPGSPGRKTTIGEADDG